MFIKSTINSHQNAFIQSPKLYSRLSLPTGTWTVFSSTTRNIFHSLTKCLDEAHPWPKVYISSDGLQRAIRDLPDYSNCQDWLATELIQVVQRQQNAGIQWNLPFERMLVSCQMKFKNYCLRRWFVRLTFNLAAVEIHGIQQVRTDARRDDLLRSNGLIDHIDVSIELEVFFSLSWIGEYN